MTGFPEFKFLTNHGNALLLIAREPTIRAREIASLLDITERAAQRIVADLARGGYLEQRREGRQSIYSIKTDLPLQEPFQRDVDIKALLELLRDHRDAAAPKSED